MNRYEDEIRDSDAASEREREMSPRRRRYVRPPVDIYSTDAEMVVVADVPGVASEDLEITLDGDDLVIEARVADRPDSESELPWGYSRRFKLRTPFDRDRIRGHVENGVLQITLPKLHGGESKRVPID